MRNEARFWICTLCVAFATVTALNAALMLEVRAHRADEPLIDASQPGAIESPEYTTYLLFSPAQCSSQFFDQVRDWTSLFYRFHGARVWVQPVAVYTSRAELGRFWDSVDFMLPTQVDPEGALLESLGVTALPAKVVVSRDGEVLYREEFPELYATDRLAGVLQQLSERR